MRFFAAVIPIIAVIVGCAAPYQVIELTDKFSAPDAPAVTAMAGNSIDFHPPLGASIRVSTLNGFAIKDKSTGKPISAGFFFDRVASDADIGLRGEPKWLAIRAGDEAVFLADGERVVLKAKGSRIDHETTRGVGYSVETDYMEFAEYPATIDQFRKIALARTLEFKFSGNNGAISYPRPNFYAILESFQKNLRQFYESQIAGK